LFEAIILMDLRQAIPSDLSLLRYWDSKSHVVAARGDGKDAVFDWERELPRRLDWRELLIAEIGGRPIGIIQIIDPRREETHYWGDVEADLRAIEIWIGEEADLGREYGSEMMRLALERCFADAMVKGVLIDPIVSNTRAHRFYERLGFQLVEFRMFRSANCLVYRLDRQAWREQTARRGQLPAQPS
jgi:aminoglycoside 6'-N-acetyltransferase